LQAQTIDVEGGNSPYVLRFAAPGSVTPLDIGVGTGAGGYSVSQTMINELTGNSGDHVGRFQIGIYGGDETLTFGGAITLPAETGFFAGNISVPTGASITVASGATSTYDVPSGAPAGILFTIDQLNEPTSAITIASGTSITAPGFVQFDDNDVGIGTTVPTFNLAGSVTGSTIGYFSSARQDFGETGSSLNILAGASLTATGSTGVPAAITLQSGRGGSLTISSGATLNAGSGEVDFYTDNLGFNGLPTVTAGTINVDTGTACNMAYESDGQTQEEPVIALGTTVAPTFGLALSTATLSSLAALAGTTPVTIGDEPRFYNGMPTDLPVEITATGSVPLPANTTIIGDAFVQSSGLLTSTGQVSINIRQPNQIDMSDPDDVLVPPAQAITLGGGITANGISLFAPEFDGFGTLTATGTSAINLANNGNILINADLTAVGQLSVQVNPGFSVTQTSGSSLSSNTGVVIYDASFSAGSTISIGGTITAPEIFLLASSLLSPEGSAGVINLNSGSTISNSTAQAFANTQSIKADTVFYTGPAGTISFGADVNVHGGYANVAFLADNFVLGTGTPSSISSDGRVIVAPASSDGVLYTNNFSVPLNNSDYLLQFNAPGGVTPASIGVGTGGGTFVVTQALINLMSGTGGNVSGASPVERLQIGLAGSSESMTIGGTLSFPAETSFDAQNITVASNAVLAASGTSTLDSGGLSATPAALIFTITQNSATASSALVFSPGSTITAPGSIQADSFCVRSVCTITPTTSFGGTMTAGEIGFFSAADEDFGSLGDSVSVLASAVLTATGTPDPTSLTSISDIVFDSGRGGSLSIASGATLNAGPGGIYLYTDHLTLNTASFTGTTINVDTGTAGNQAFSGTPTANGDYIQEEPAIALGTTTSPAVGLALSNATLTTLSADAGSIPVTIGDVTRYNFFSDTGELLATPVPFTTPVVVSVAGNATLPANTTITADAFTQSSGTTLSGGTLVINTRTPSNLADAFEQANYQELPPTTLPSPTISLAGGITTTGSQTFNGAVVLTGTETLTANGTVTFTSTLDDGSNPRTGTLTINAGANGDVSFDGLVGNNSALGKVVIGTARNVTGPAVNSTSLASGTPEFQAASFSAGAGTPLNGAFTMLGGISTNAPTNAFSSTSSTSSRGSGALFIDASGAVTIGTNNTTNSSDDLVASARGADFSSSSANSSSVAGNGGTITIIGSTLMLAGVQDRGGDAKTGSVLVGNGGNGGTVTLTATNGAVTVLGSLLDTGVNAEGGESTLASGGQGGNAGTITIDATGNVIVPGGVRVNGGGAISGVGGNAGTITIDASTIMLGRALAQGGDTQATGTGAGGGTGGSITLIATATGGTAITLAGNDSDFSGASGALSYGTVLTRGGETGVTDVFNTDQGGTVANAGGKILLEGSTAGAALGGAVELVSSGTDTSPAGAFGAGSNVVISASGISGEGGTIQILGSIVAADADTEGLRLGATNGTVDVTGSVGTKGGNRLSSLLLSGNGSAITIGGDVATDAILELRTSGSFTIDGDISTSAYTTPLGNTVLLNFLNTGGGGNSSSQTLDSVLIAGTFLFASPVSLAGNAVTLTGTTVIDTSTNNTAVTLGTVDGPFGLTINAGTGAVTSGTIGGNTALSSLTINAGAIGLGSVSTIGAQAYTGPTSLAGSYNATSFNIAGPTILSATSVVNAATAIFTGTIDGTTAGAQSLTVTVTGSAEFDGAIGSTTALDNFTLTASSVTGSLPSIFVTGAQTINLPNGSFSGTYSFDTFTDDGAMILSGDTVITATGGAITIGGTVDGAHALTLNDSVGLISLTGTVGSGTALTSLTLTGSQGIVLGGTINTTGAQAYNGAVTLASTTTLNGAGGITFSSTVDGAQALTLNAGSAAAAIQGAAGAQAALASLTATGGTLSFGSVTTTGAQTYNGTATINGTYTANGFTAGGALTMLGNTTINGGTGDITFDSTVQGQFNLALASTNANIFFDGTVGLSTARVSLLSITGADNATVENNSSLYVHDFTATNIGGTLTFGNHSLESDDVVTIQATSVDGRVISTTSATIDATSVSGIIQGSTVNVTATGAVSEQITADSATVSSGSFSGSVAATRSANIAATGDESGDISVSGGSATVSGANVSGSVTSSGLAQISASQNVSADVTGGSVTIAAGQTVSGAVTATSGSVGITATDVSSTIVAQGGGTVQVAATGSITGSVSGGAVSLSAPTVSEQVTATSANISSSNVTVTGTIGGIDASAVQATTSNVTQSVLGATQQVASNAATDNTGATEDDTGNVTTADGDTTDDKKKKAKEKGAVYDFANQYIDSLIAGKKAP